MSILLASDSTDVNESDGQFQIARMPFSAIAFLILSIALILVWSHYQLLWSDEFCALGTDGVPSLLRLIHIQVTTPVSLDPIA